MISTKHIVSRSFLAAVLALSGLVGVASAADYSAGSQAKEWGLTEEEKALFSGKVVDILCELSGDCPDSCGNGLRQLGIVRDADNQLISVLKNSQAAFNGAADDLLPYCNKAVEVDGLLIGDLEEVTAKYYMVQFIRNQGDADWNKTKLWTKEWARKNPGREGKGPWFRRDPRVAAQIEARGHFGLGHDADQKYLEENE